MQKSNFKHFLFLLTVNLKKAKYLPFEEQFGHFGVCHYIILYIPRNWQEVIDSNGKYLVWTLMTNVSFGQNGQIVTQNVNLVHFKRISFTFLTL